MSVVRSRDFLSFVRTQELIKELSKHQPTSDSALIAILRTTGALPLLRFQATLRVLLAVGLCTRQTDGNLVVRGGLAGKPMQEVKAALANGLLVLLQAESLLPEFCLGLNRKDGAFRLNVMMIPQSLSGATFLLFEYGVLLRSEDTSYIAIIASGFERHFLRGALLGNQHLLARGFSLSQLKEAKALQEEQGREAEAWMLAFERRRLESHPLVDHVVCISERASDAGFDIASFSNTDALIYDRYIEVKSYRHRPHFYWSANEIDVAKTMGDQYLLALVDVALCSSLAYNPLTIADPYAYFFLNDQKRWAKRANDYYFEATDA